jgi:hypothetical protein
VIIRTDGKCNACILLAFEQASVYLMTATDWAGLDLCFCVSGIEEL